MLYKGYSFRVARSVVMLPPDPNDLKNNYVKFGRICAATVKGAVPTNYHLGGGAVYAKPVKLLGHSLTNMARGADGKMYLARDGACYTAWCLPAADRARARIEKRLRSALS